MISLPLKLARLRPPWPQDERSSLEVDADVDAVHQIVERQRHRGRVHRGVELRIGQLAAEPQHAGAEIQRNDRQRDAGLRTDREQIRIARNVTRRHAVAADHAGLHVLGVRRPGICQDGAPADQRAYQAKSQAKTCAKSQAKTCAKSQAKTCAKSQAWTCAKKSCMLDCLKLARVCGKPHQAAGRTNKSTFERRPRPSIEPTPRYRCFT